MSSRIDTQILRNNIQAKIRRLQEQQRLEAHRIAEQDNIETTEEEWDEDRFKHLFQSRV